ncbi:VOC family protein [Sulfitobacter sp. BDSS02]|uniref:VOC family protein n=1 Tax=Heliomarina sp. TaxID=2917556 RepID=UPI00405A385F|nr:VOC family protein [Sulfitobacter sp. BDSS02]MBR9848189.1 VOC family protein [Paracoccaceae bacterium]
MITQIDHLVLTVRDIETSVAFYETVLGMRVQTFAQGRKALHFGNQKINLQTLGQETRNHACIGSGDVCLITDWAAEKLLEHLARHDVAVLEGPVTKTGARGPITSVYFNDPDGNLIEVSSYD